jgi:hypothetical protein
LLIWAMIGVAMFYRQLTLNQAALAAMSDYDRSLFARLPSWFIYDFALATLTGLVAALLMLLRSAIAMPLYLLSLIGVITQFGWLLGATDIIAVKGVGGAAIGPFIIFTVSVFALWVAIIARGRRWIA